MDCDKRGALWFIPSIAKPGSPNHRKMNGTDRMHLQVIPKIPFKVVDRLAPPLGGNCIVLNVPFHSCANRPIRVATEMHFKVASRRARTDPEPETARASCFR